MSKAVKLKNSNFLASTAIVHKRGGGWYYLNNLLDDIHNNIDKILDKVYPIGSIYISNNSTNPSNLFGGKWEQIDETLEIEGTILDYDASSGWRNNCTITLPKGRWLIIGSASGYGSGTGFTLQLTSRGAYTRTSIHCSDSNMYSGQVVDLVTVESEMVVNLQSWSAIGRTMYNLILKAFKVDTKRTGDYMWRRIG